MTSAKLFRKFSWACNVIFSLETRSNTTWRFSHPLILLLQATGILILPLSKNSEGVKDQWDQWDPYGKIQHSSLCSQGVYHKPFEACLIATLHRAGIVGIGLVILLFHVVKIVHYLHHLVFGAVMLLQRRTKQAVGLGMTGITLLDMLDWILIHVASNLEGAYHISTAAENGIRQSAQCLFGFCKSFHFLIYFKKLNIFC